MATVAGMILHVDGVLNQTILQLGETAMRSYVRRIVVSVVAILMASGSARAEWVDTFDGGFDQTWVYDSLTGLGGPSGSFEFVSVNNMLQVQDLTTAAVGGAASGFGLVNETFSNFVVGAVVNPAGEGNMNREVGLLARMNVANLTGYALTVDYFEDSGAISLSRIDLGPNIVGIASGSLSSFASENSVYIEFQGKGDTLTGSVYDSYGGLLLGSVETTDASYGAGWSGVVVNSQDNAGVALRGTYDVVFASVPEPSSLVMLISGCLCAFGLARRRRRRQS